MSNEFKLNAGESECMSTSAGKIGFFITSGGNLLLTNHRLLYRNRRKSKIIWECNLSDIQNTSGGRNISIIGLGLIFPFLFNPVVKVLLKSGESHQFFTYKKKEWLATINKYHLKAS